VSEDYLKTPIQSDNEGYITFSCPYCHSDFKLQSKELQSEKSSLTELFCPYCGLVKEKSSFYSDELIQNSFTLLKNYMIDACNESISAAARSINHNNSAIKMTYRPLDKESVKEIKENDTPEVAFECKSCGHHVKALYCSGTSKIFCPYCGEDI